MNFNDMEYFRQISGLFQTGEIWLSVTYLAGMFLVITFRPNQIASPGSFRMSYLLFVLYFIIPNCITAIISLVTLEGANRGNLTPMFLIAHQLADILGKILFGFAIILGLNSLRCRETEEGTPARGRTE